MIRPLPKVIYSKLLRLLFNNAKFNLRLFIDVGTEGAENDAETEDTKKSKKKRKPHGKAGGPKQQTDPPTVPVSQFFPDGNFPIGQIMDYPPTALMDDRTAKERYSSEEARAFDRMREDIHNAAREAAEAHRQTRKYIKKWVCNSNKTFYNKGHWRSSISL